LTGRARPATLRRDAVGSRRGAARVEVDAAIVPVAYSLFDDAGAALRRLGERRAA
jgi:hypothetical protein